MLRYAQVHEPASARDPDAKALDGVHGLVEVVIDGTHEHLRSVIKTKNHMRCDTHEHLHNQH